MRRAAFGVTGADVDRVGADVEKWVADALNPGADPGVDATPPPTFAAIPAVGANDTREERQARNTAVNDQGDQLTQWWLTRMVVAQPTGTGASDGRVAQPLGVQAGRRLAKQA